MDLAILIVVVMVLLFIGSFVIGMTVGVPGAIKEPRQPKVAPELAPTVASRGPRPVRDPDDSPGARIMVMLGVLAAALIVLAVAAIVIGLPVREAYAADRQATDNVNRGAMLFITDCAKCHGSTGQGAVGPNLHLNVFSTRSKLNPGESADLQKLRDLATKTIAHGRTGTAMPAWGRDDGGPLSDTQISNLVDLIATDGWAAVAAAPVAAAVPTPAAPAAGGDPGVALITKYGCGGCHTISAIPGAVGTVGPNLSKEGANPKVPMSTGALDNNPANLAKWVLNAPSIKPGIAMPNFSSLNMTQDEADKIAAYLETLK